MIFQKRGKWVATRMEVGQGERAIRGWLLLAQKQESLLRVEGLRDCQLGTQPSEQLLGRREASTATMEEMHRNSIKSRPTSEQSLAFIVTAQNGTKNPRLSENMYFLDYLRNQEWSRCSRRGRECRRRDES